MCQGSGIGSEVIHLEAQSEDMGQKISFRGGSWQVTVNSYYYERLRTWREGGERTHFVESRTTSVNLETRLSTMILGTAGIAS